MKKYLIILCAALLCASSLALTACSSSGSGGIGEMLGIAKDPAEGVSPDLREFGEEALAVCDRIEDFANNVNGSEDLDIDELMMLGNDFSNVLFGAEIWSEDLDELSETDRNYFTNTIYPALVEASETWEEVNPLSLLMGM